MKGPTRMNNSYIRNALRSIAKITVESVTDYAPETRSVVKNSSIASAAKSIKADPNLKSQFKKASKKLMGVKEDEAIDSYEVEKPVGTDYKVDIKNLKKNLPDPEPFNMSHAKNNYFVKDINYKTYSKAIYRTIASIGQSNQASLCRIEHRLNMIIQDLDNDLLFFSNTIRDMSNISADISHSLNSFNRYVDVKTGVGSAKLTTDAVLNYMRVEKMFSIAEVVKEFKKGGVQEADIVGEWLSNTFTSKAATVLTFMTNNFSPKNVRKLGNDIKSTVMNVNAVIQYTLKDMSESNNPIFVMLADRLGFRSKKSKAYSYKKGKVSFDGITKRAIVRVIPTLLSKILTAIDREHYPNELTYDYNRGVFTNEEDVRKLRRKYRKVNKDYKGVRDLKDYRHQTKAYKEYSNRFSSSDKIGKDDYSMYEEEKVRIYRKNRKIRATTGAQFNIGAKITGKLQDKLNKFDKWLFSLPSDPKSLELIMDRGFGLGDGLYKENGKLNLKKVLSLTKDTMLYGIPNVTRKVISKIIHIQLQPLSFYMDKVKTKLVKTLKLDYVKELYSTAKGKVKEFIKGPVTDLIVNARLSLAKFISTSLMRFTRFIDNQTKFINNVLIGEGVRTVTDGMEEANSKITKKMEVDNTFKRSEDAITSIYKRLKATILSPIREQYKIYSSEGAINNLQSIDTSLVNILYKMGIEPSMTLHKKYGISFKEKLKKWLFRPLKHILGYFKDVVKEMHLIKNMAKIPKLIGKVIKTGFKTIDRAVTTVTEFLKIANPLLKTVGKVIKDGTRKIADIHKLIMSHTKNAVDLVFTRVVPTIIDGAGKITVTLIKAGGGAAKFAATSFLKLSGTAIYGGLKAVNGLIKGVGKVITTIDTIRKHLFIKNGETYEGNLVGGKLDNIYSSVEYYEVKTARDKFKEEDEEDKADDKKVKGIVSKVRSVIGEKLAAKTEIANKLLFGALSFGSNMLARTLTSVVGFGLGGVFGGLIGNVADKLWNTKLGQKFKSFLGKKKEANAMRVYIVGGSVDGNAGLLDSLTSKDKTGDVVEDVIEDVADNNNGKKSLLKRGLNFAKKHKKGLGIAAAVTAAGTVAYKSYKKSDEVKALEEISNEIGTVEPTNKLIDQGNETIKRIDSVPTQLKAAGNDKNVNESEAFDLTKGKGKINNRMLKGVNLFNNEVATTKNTADTVDKLVANKRSQVEVDDRNEKVLYGKLTDEEKLERLSQQGALGVIGEINKPQSPAKLNDNRSSFRGILERWKYGFVRGGMLGGAFCALGAKHMLNNKKLMAEGLGMSEDEFKKYLEQINKSGANNNNNNNQDSSQDNSQNGAGTNSASGYIWPVPGHTRISSPFGMRNHPIDHVPKMHTGIDISAPSGADIVAVRAGTVVSAKSSGGYGNFTQIQHEDGNMTCYAHQSKFLVKAGDVVSQGQVIGKVGSTGKSTGPHLHFEVRTKSPYSSKECVDPQKYVSPNSVANPATSGTTNPNGTTDAGKALTTRSYITNDNVFNLNFSKISTATVPDINEDDSPDPNYVSAAEKRRATAVWSSSPESASDVNSDGNSGNGKYDDDKKIKATNYPKIKPIKVRPVLSNKALDDTETYDECDSCLDSPSGGLFDIIEGLQMMDEKFGTTNIKKIHNTSSVIADINNEMNNVKAQVYATLVALLEELNDETDRLRDSANIAIITEVKKQIEVIDNMEDIVYSDIVNINNSILKIAAGC